MYTCGTAYSAFEESYKRALSPGKLVDLVLPDGDPTAVPSEELKETEATLCKATACKGRSCVSQRV